MRYWILLLVLLPLASFHAAFAQSAQVQPILGFAWPTHSIPVSIETSQSNERQAVLNAIRTWNLAQQWFITTYAASHAAPFVFYATNSTFESMVTIKFNQTQTIDYLGWTSTHELHDQQGNFRIVTVSVTIDLTKQDGTAVSDVELQTLATHEMGHALGLDHTNFSPEDLMNPVPKVIFPSTLNLYAVYLLGMVTKVKDLPQQQVALPVNIPYVIASESDLDSVTPPVTQTTSTTSFGMNQLVYAITYGPWLWVGILAVLAGAIVASTRRRRKGSANAESEAEAQIIVREEPITEDKPNQSKKKCRYCGAEARREYLICPRCGMPLYT
jgi:Matrixin